MYMQFMCNFNKQPSMYVVSLCLYVFVSKVFAFWEYTFIDSTQHIKVQHTLGTSFIFLFFSVSSISCILPSLLFMVWLSRRWNLSQLQQKVRTVKVIKSTLSLQPAVRLCNSLWAGCLWVCDLQPIYNKHHYSHTRRETEYIAGNHSVENRVKR